MRIFMRIRDSHIAPLLVLSYLIQITIFGLVECSLGLAVAFSLSLALATFLILINCACNSNTVIIVTVAGCKGCQSISSGAS